MVKRQRKVSDVYLERKNTQSSVCSEPLVSSSLVHILQRGSTKVPWTPTIWLSDSTKRSRLYIQTGLHVTWSCGTFTRPRRILLRSEILFTDTIRNVVWMNKVSAWAFLEEFSCRFPIKSCIRCRCFKVMKWMTMSFSVCNKAAHQNCHSNTLWHSLNNTCKKKKKNCYTMLVV